MDDALFGRTEELSQVEHLLARGAKGRGSVAFIVGEAGIGKTRLVEALTARAAMMDFQVFMARAAELEQQIPFGVVAEALGLSRRAPDPQRAAIAEQLSSPDEPAWEPGDLRFRVIESIEELVDRLCLEGPTLLVLEDLQWADPSSLLVIGRLARRRLIQPLVLVCTHRPSRSRSLARLLRHLAASARRISVGPLEDEAVIRLASSRLGGMPGPTLRESLASTGGNPLFVIELIEALKSEGALVPAEGHVEIEERLVPPSLRLTILRLFEDLSDESLETLRLASVLGTSFDPRDVAIVRGDSGPEVVRALDEPIRQGLISGAGRTLRFRHDLVRDAIYYDSPLAVRRMLHAEVGRALAAAGAPAVQVATHMMLGAAPGDGDAVRWLQRAAVDAADRAPSIAVEFLEAALEIADPDASTHSSLFADLLDPLIAVGRLGEAETMARRLLAERPTTSELAKGGAALVRSLHLQAKFTHLVDVVNELIAEQRLPPSAAARLLAEAAFGFADSGVDNARARELTGEALSVAHDVGDPFAISMARCGEVMVEYYDGRMEESAVAGRRAVMSGEATDHHAALVRACNIHGTALQHLDRLDEAQAELYRGLQTAERLGAVGSLPEYHHSIAILAMLRGRWNESIAELETALERAEEVGAQLAALDAYQTMATLSVRRGDVRRARAQLRRLESFTGPGGGFDRFLTLHARAVVRGAEGDAEASGDAAERAHRIVADRGLIGLYSWSGIDLVRAAMSTRREVAEEITALLEELARRAPLPYLRAQALNARGLVEGNVSSILESIEAYGSSSRYVRTAEAHEDAGIGLTRAHRPSEAILHLEQAAQAYVRIGAVRDHSRALARLRELGVKRGSGGPRKRPKTGWDALTKTERVVAGLIAEGLSNKEVAAQLYISPRTVETHAVHLLRKLDVSSRSELIALIARGTS